MGKPIVLDLETKKTFRDVGGVFPEKLGISVAGVYSYADDSFKAYLEKDLDQLFPLLERASLIIGYNSSKFDLPVLSPYYVGNVLKFPHLDLMEDIRKSLGRRIALNEFAIETLGTKKSGHGLLAVNYYNEGKIEELKKYCLDDVRITKDLYEYGKKNGKIYYKGPFGRIEVKVHWKEINTDSKDINLTLPV